MSIGMIRFTNDSVEGMYEVQPSSGKLKKISDIVFDVVFVYDNTHILGCDEKMNIWLFDLENMVSTLLF